MEQTATASEVGNGAASTAPVGQEATIPVSWHADFDADTVGWLENRGITKLPEKEAIKNLTNGFRNAEKHIGTPPEKLLRLPDFAKAEKAELDAFYNKLGRPETPDAYELDIPEGQPTEFADWAKSQFHELGLNNSQAKALSAKWNEYVGQMQEKQVEQLRMKTAEDETALRRDWGAAYEKNVSMAKQAAQSFGITAEELDGMEMSMGYGGIMRMMAKLGSRMGEAEYISGNSQNSFGPLSPQQAASRIVALRGDNEWVSKYLAGNMDARQEMESLMKQAYPGG